jgi:hypothetical protein
MSETVADTTMTLSDIRARLYWLTKESTSSTLFPCSEVTDIVNMSLGKVYGAVNYAYDVVYRNTCSGVEGYEIPEAKVVNGNAVVDQLWVCDAELSPSDYTEWNECSDTAGKPCYYWVNGKTVHLNPIPDSCYPMKIRYRPEFHKLSACSDIPHMTDLQIDAAIFYGAHVMKAKDEEYEAAAFFKRMYDETMAEVMMIPPGLYRAGVAYGGAA